MTFKILVPIGCRSDEGLSAPVIQRLEKYFDVTTIRLTPQDFRLSYNIIEGEIRWASTPYDLIFITGDRVEMCSAACAAFHNNVKIAHLYAGVVNDPITTYDDVDRHCITLWSDIQFCENEEAAHQVVNFLRGIKAAFPDVVGITHLDDMDIDESKVPPGDYDLILYNTPTKTNKDIEDELLECLLERREEYCILVSGNPDGDKEIGICQDVNEFHIDLPRPQFLGLLKNCRRFITNSSSAIYEAPYFLKPDQIVMIGDRNRNRPAVDCKPGGSDKIVDAVRCYFGVEKTCDKT